MTQGDAAWRQSPLTWIGALVGSLLFFWALLRWPYHFAMPELISGSYTFGYNNRVGQLIVAAWLVCLAVFGPALRLRDATAKPLTRSTRRKALLLTGFVAFGLYLGTREVNGVNEAIYFLDRLHLTLAGRLPYRDQEFIYGAGMLYLPALLTWSLHLPPPDAYGLVFVSSALLGVFLLYGTLSAVTEFPGTQRAVFLLSTAGGLLNLASFGLNYSALRFILPCYLATRVHGALFSERRARLGFLLPVPFYALVLLWSPELAVAFAMGMVGYLAVFGLRFRPGHAGVLAVTVVGLALVTGLAARAHVFAGMAGFSQGGYNFPIVLSPFLLIFLVTAGLCALYLGGALRHGDRGVLPILIAGSALSMAAALGRCDQGHVLTDPMGVLLAGFFLLGGYLSLRRALFALAWVITFLLPLPGAVKGTVELMAKAALPAFFGYEARHGGGSQTPTDADAWILTKMTNVLGSRERAQEKIDDFRAFGTTTGPLNVAKVFGLKPGTAVYAPFGFAPGHQGTSHPHGLDEGYFFALVNVVTPGEVDRKIGEIEQSPRRPMVMLPNFREQCGTTGEDTRALMGALTSHRYNAPVLHPLSLAVRVRGAIESEFHPAGPPTGSQFGYQLWLPDHP